ncbi:hypothetical protein E8E13_004669 [Curvularia kusanoi]|uniref:PQ loop repeat protein n=1 Tax=Curvularia kusanoi TaxID=90978 RepID=A0A9P4TJV7_CURKU|nr:hypothetical protein E8E13_004669 [Curvularia kusanoi]
MDRPQVSIPPAADVLGTLGTVAGVFRSSHSGVPFGVYAIVQNFSFALQFQPQAFAALTLISWGQTLYYHNKWKAWAATVATILLAASFGVMELILILTLQGPYDRGVKWPMMLMAISATLIQIAGLITPYFELAKRNGRVVGIDFWFLLIDYSGAFFSLMALVAQQWFDSLGGSLYIACMLLETGIFLSQAIWLWRVRHVRREAKRAGMSYDQYVAENPSKKIPRSESAETIVDVEACHGSQRQSEPDEKQDTATKSEDIPANVPATTSPLVQKWRNLVLRPVPNCS